MAISVVATQPSVGAPTVRYLAPFIDERSVESIAKYLTVMEQQEGHWLYTDATAKLADVCREIVAALDSESLESARKIREKLAGSR